MPDDPQPEDAAPAPAGAGWGFYLVPLLIVLGVGGLFWLGKRPAVPDGNEEQEKSSAPVQVVAGKDYFVLVTVMEFHRAKRGGSNWDAGGSPPDIFYYLHWRDNAVFHTKNDVAKDALIARWFGLGADIKVTDLGRLLLPSGKRITPRNAIKAGLIKAADGETILIRAIDNDPVGDDLAGRCEIGVMDLRLGDNAFYIDADGKPVREAERLAKDRGGLARLVLRVVDASLPVEELVKALR